jgi:DNA-binding SARP family transcriptional activator
MSDSGQIRIRVLGNLGAHRSDGTEVHADEWRTGKTRDLVRLLALADPSPVRVPSLLEKLWPDAGVAVSRNRLRTAASQIRRTLRDSHCLVRESDALRLQNVWVDVTAFRRLAARAHLAARSGASSEVLDCARAAQRLYQGDFQAHDDDSDWAVEERAHLQRRLQEMLCEAAEAALDLGLFREALDLATSTVQLEPTSETGHRVLMQAQAELGEFAKALRVFETYRSGLADELGVDPSPQTQELYLRILRGFSDSEASPLRR